MPIKRSEKDGKYHIGRGVYSELIGSRAQVMHSNAYKTTGNLKKKDLVMNKNGRIVSRKARKTAKENNRLVKAGYLTEKGKFGFIPLKRKQKTRKMKGGAVYTLSPGDDIEVKCPESQGENENVLGMENPAANAPELKAIKEEEAAEAEAAKAGGEGQPESPF